MKALRFLLPAVLLTPAFAFAQLGEIGDLATGILNFINNILVPLFFAIAFLAFVWGVFRYVISGGADATKRKEGQQLMLSAIIGFVVIVSIWGIVNLIAGGLGIDENNQVTLPKLPGATTQ